LPDTYYKIFPFSLAVNDASGKLSYMRNSISGADFIANDQKEAATELVLSSDGKITNYISDDASTTLTEPISFVYIDPTT
jgi:hypothetical protein